jgi:anaerobic magnesium-protoporphyrin IX monomethyl ester cyclase
MSKPNVLFVNFPAMSLPEVRSLFAGGGYSGRGGYQYIDLPQGLLYLSAYAKKENAVGEVYLLDYLKDFTLVDEVTTVEDFIRDRAKTVPFKPDVIAVSINFTPSHDLSVLACNMFRDEIWPNATTVVGGHHSTSCGPQLLEHRGIDYVVRGEGEIGFVDFLRNFGKSTDEDVQGFYTEETIGNRPWKACDAVDDMDDLPPPDWEILDMDYYLTCGSSRARKFGDESPENRRVATFSSTRGCPFSCTFCSSHLVHGRSMRFMSVEKVIAELSMLRDRYGVNAFFPDDDLFTANKKRMKKLLTAFRDELPDCELQAPGGMSINTLDLEVLKLFHEVGTEVFSLAVESGDEYVQREIIKKRCNLEKAKEQVSFLRELGTIIRVFFIIGFPEETYEQMQNTIRFAANLDSDWNAFNVAMPLPGSEMFDEFRDMGVVDDNISRLSENYNVRRKFDTPHVTAEQVRDLAFYANVEVNFLNNTNYAEGKYERALFMYEDITKQFDWHIVGWYCIMRCLYRLGREEDGNAVHTKIHELVKNDERAADMYSKVFHLLPEMEHAGLESKVNDDNEQKGLGIEVSGFDVKSVAHAVDRGGSPVVGH